jgi:hypothetical protein
MKLLRDEPWGQGLVLTSLYIYNNNDNDNNNSSFIYALSATASG